MSDSGLESDRASIEEEHEKVITLEAENESSSEASEESADEEVDLRGSPDSVADGRKDNGQQSPRTPQTKAGAAGEPVQYRNPVFAQRVATSRLSQRLASGTSVLDDSFLLGADTLTHNSRGECCASSWVLGGARVCLRTVCAM
jgi:hypothetical protein